MIKFVFLTSVLFSLLFSSEWAWCVSQSTIETKPENSLEVIQSIQKSLHEKEKTLLLNQKILLENSILLQQNLAVLYKIRKIRKDNPEEWDTLTEAIQNSEGALQENQQVLFETREAVASQKKIYAKNQRMMDDLQKGHFVLDFNKGENSSALLEQLNQSIQESQLILEKNRGRLLENQTSFHGNKQILATLISNAK